MAEMLPKDTLATANSVGPDQTRPSLYPDLYCLLKPIYPLKCLSIGTLKIINFPFVSNVKINGFYVSQYSCT